MKFQHLFNKLEQVLVPFAAKVDSNKSISAIKLGFMLTMPFMIMGSIVLILAFPPFSADTTNTFGRIWLDWAATNKISLMIPNVVTMGLMSVWVVMGIAAALANLIDADKVVSAMSSLLALITISVTFKFNAYGVEDMNIVYLGANGLFTAMLLGLTVPRFLKWCKDKKIGFGLPDSVPESVRKAFDMLIPFMVIFAVLIPLSVLCQSLTGMLIPQAILALISPLLHAVDSLPAILLTVLIVHILWFVGVHGNSLALGILAPVLLGNIASNAMSFAAGEPLPYIFDMNFWGFYVLVGGSGATVGLVIHFVRSKSEHLRAIAKVGGVPSLFQINEPIIFGTPIVMNPLLFIPFIITPMITATIAWFAIGSGLVPAASSLVPWTTPMFIGAVWASGWAFSAFILAITLIAVSWLIYFPFFKMYEKQLIEQESNA